MPNFVTAGGVKLYQFPESWIELRKELSTHWKFDQPSPRHPNWNDPRCGWAMAFDAPLFLEYMNEHLGSPVGNVQMVTNNQELHITYICKTFLKELRKRRGESNP